MIVSRIDIVVPGVGSRGVNVLLYDTILMLTKLCHTDNVKFILLQSMKCFLFIIEREMLYTTATKQISHKDFIMLM